MHENSLKNLKPWHPGQSGNPTGTGAGRPARARLTEAFVSDMAASWSQHGPKVLSDLARTQPAAFAGLCAKLIPQDVALTIEQRLPGNLSPDDWSLMLEVMNGIKQALPDANQRQPGQVLGFVKDAITAHSAPLIDHTENPSELDGKKPA